MKGEHNMYLLAQHHAQQAFRSARMPGDGRQYWIVPEISCALCGVVTSARSAVAAPLVHFPQRSTVLFASCVNGSMAVSPDAEAHRRGAANTVPV